MQTNLSLELVRVTEAAALAAARTMGLGDVEQTHQAAMKSMSLTLQKMSIQGEVVLGEGEPGETQWLARGSVVGQGSSEVALIVHAIDGPSSCAHGGGYSLSVISAAKGGGFLNTPDISYEKIAVGPIGKGVIDLKLEPQENLKRVAEAKNLYVQDLTVGVLDRPRHTELIQNLRDAGARIRLISGGDISGALATCDPESGVDLLIGVGRAREGLLAASGLYAMGGDMQMRPKPSNRKEQDALYASGINDAQQIFKLDDLVRGQIFFAATGVTRSEFLDGIQFRPGGAVSHSLAVRSESGTVRRIRSVHHFDLNPVYE